MKYFFLSCLMAYNSRKIDQLQLGMDYVYVFNWGYRGKGGKIGHRMREL